MGGLDSELPLPPASGLQEDRFGVGLGQPLLSILRSIHLIHLSNRSWVAEKRARIKLLLLKVHTGVRHRKSSGLRTMPRVTGMGSHLGLMASALDLDLVQQCKKVVLLQVKALGSRLSLPGLAGADSGHNWVRSGYSFAVRPG